MLGFLDDVFDIRWRHKLPIPVIASIPLLMVYYAERGNTHVVVPLPLRSFFGTLINLGMTGHTRICSDRGLKNSRAVILYVHVIVVDICDEQHQYSSWNQWFRS